MLLGEEDLLGWVGLGPVSFPQSEAESTWAGLPQRRKPVDKRVTLEAT